MTVDTNGNHMKRALRVAGIIALEVVIVASLVGLAVGTIWLFHYGKGKGWSTWVWIPVLLEGIGALFFIPVGLMMSFTFTKEKIRVIKEENK